MPRILAVLMVLHAILSIILLIKNRKGINKNKHKKYSELNIGTYVQRISGVLIILMMGLHLFIIGTVGQGPLQVFRHPECVSYLLFKFFYAAIH